MRFVLFHSDWTMNRDVHSTLIEAEFTVKIVALVWMKEVIWQAASLLITRGEAAQSHQDKSFWLAFVIFSSNFLAQLKRTALQTPISPWSLTPAACSSPYPIKARKRPVLTAISQSAALTWAAATPRWRRTGTTECWRNGGGRRVPSCSGATRLSSTPRRRRTSIQMARERKQGLERKTGGNTMMKSSTGEQHQSKRCFLATQTLRIPRFLTRCTVKRRCPGRGSPSWEETSLFHCLHQNNQSNTSSTQIKSQSGPQDWTAATSIPSSSRIALFTSPCPQNLPWKAMAPLSQSFPPAKPNHSVWGSRWRAPKHISSSQTPRGTARWCSSARTNQRKETFCAQTALSTWLLRPASSWAQQEVHHTVAGVWILLFQWRANVPCQYTSVTFLRCKFRLPRLQKKTQSLQNNTEMKALFVVLTISQLVGAKLVAAKEIGGSLKAQTTSKIQKGKASLAFRQISIDAIRGHISSFRIWFWVSLIWPKLSRIGRSGLAGLNASISPSLFLTLPFWVLVAVVSEMEPTLSLCV